MNPDTGAIAQFETEEDAKESGYTVSLTKEQAGELAGMNRHKRRAWLAQNRKQLEQEAVRRELEANTLGLIAELEKRASEGQLEPEDFEKNA